MTDTFTFRTKDFKPIIFLDGIIKDSMSRAECIKKIISHACGDMNEKDAKYIAEVLGLK